MVCSLHSYLILTAADLAPPQLLPELPERLHLQETLIRLQLEIRDIHLDRLLGPPTNVA